VGLEAEEGWLADGGGWVFASQLLLMGTFTVYGSGWVLDEGNGALLQNVSLTEDCRANSNAITIYRSALAQILQYHCYCSTTTGPSRAEQNMFGSPKWVR
jgi:hypothetical protein